MKGKKLQQRLLYPARVSFRFNREIKSFTDKQKLREFSNTKPALQQMLKGVSLDKKPKERKDLQKQTQNNKVNDNRIIYIKNYPKWKWIKCSNQKIHTG